MHSNYSTGIKFNELKAVKHKDIRFAYEVYGRGENVFLCFHGNDRSPKDFEFLAQTNRKIIAVYLFFHGDSQFSDQRLATVQIKTEELLLLVKDILTQEKVNRFHLLAYSQGGRFALCIYPFLADKIDTLTLIAPDGLRNRNFYSWSQRQAWARHLFKHWIKKPKELRYLTHLLVRTKIIHPKMDDFMEHYTSSKEVMVKAYKTWSGFRRLRPNYTLIKEVLSKYTTDFQVIIGEHDHIITQKSAKKFLSRIHQESALTVIPYGHDVFKAHILPVLQSRIVNPKDQ